MIKLSLKTPSSHAYNYKYWTATYLTAFKKSKNMQYQTKLIYLLDPYSLSAVIVVAVVVVVELDVVYAIVVVEVEVIAAVIIVVVVVVVKLEDVDAIVVVDFEVAINVVVAVDVEAAPFAMSRLIKLIPAPFSAPIGKKKYPQIRIVVTSQEIEMS